MVKLMLGAFQIAKTLSLPAIDSHCLEQAFSEHVWVEGVGKLNPFNPEFIGERLDKRGIVFYKAPVLEVIRSQEKKL